MIQHDPKWYKTIKNQKDKKNSSKKRSNIYTLPLFNKNKLKI